MLQSHKNWVKCRVDAGGVVATVLCLLFGAGADLACSSDATPNSTAGAAGAVSSSGGSTVQGGAPSAGASNGSAGQSSGAAGNSSGGTSSGAGAGGSPVTGQAGASAIGGGGHGGAPGVAGAGGGSSSGACTRELLKATTSSYFAALAAHDPSLLPLADNLKFTENGKESKPADAPLWKTAGTLKYSHSALDVETCNAATQAVVPDGAKDIPVAVRIKLVNQKITEIETIAARAGDYTGVSSNTTALAATKDTIEWEEPVASDQRNTRGELTAWMTKYFKQFPAGVCNTTSTCKRIENGGGNFVCSEGASCAASSSAAVLNPRLVLADVETGVGVGFTLFTGGHPDMHMFKMRGGQVYAVSAILSKGDSTGWD